MDCPWIAHLRLSDFQDLFERPKRVVLPDLILLPHALQCWTAQTSSVTIRSAQVRMRVSLQVVKASHSAPGASDSPPHIMLPRRSCPLGKTQFPRQPNWTCVLCAPSAQPSLTRWLSVEMRILSRLSLWTGQGMTATWHTGCTGAHDRRHHADPGPRNSATKYPRQCITKASVRLLLRHVCVGSVSRDDLFPPAVDHFPCAGHRAHDVPRAAQCIQTENHCKRNTSVFSDVEKAEVMGVLTVSSLPQHSGSRHGGVSSEDVHD